MNIESLALGLAAVLALAGYVAVLIVLAKRRQRRQHERLSRRLRELTFPPAKRRID